LSAAYFLALRGHSVTIFEAMPLPGGMLRYGIPSYRLPKEVLDKEISDIVKLGVTIQTGKHLGKDFKFDSLFEGGFKAVFLATGAGISIPLDIPGEDMEGVVSGLGFLSEAYTGTPSTKGRRVAVIGGGNTAMDAARTALRLGSEKVTVLYRRSRDDMPAINEEIEDAEAEGIEFTFQAAPLRFEGGNAGVEKVICGRTEPGKPDESGRASPQLVPGSEFAVAADLVIVASGQRPDLSYISAKGSLPGSAQSFRPGRGGTIQVDKDTLFTGINGVFAGGDLVTGAATAIEAMAAGRKAALAISEYLKDGRTTPKQYQFNSARGSLEQADIQEYSDIKRVPRELVKKLEPASRTGSFDEIATGFSLEQAQNEAARCLQCGCYAIDKCVLRALATRYGMKAPETRAKYTFPVDNSNPFVERDDNKCVLCGLCGRICRDYLGVGALPAGFRPANISTMVPLKNTSCITCGECIDVCPVGTLNPDGELKSNSFAATICPYCSVGCGLQLNIKENAVLNARGDVSNPVNQGQICFRGRFGCSFANHPDRLTHPMVRRNGKLVEASWDEALDMAASGFKDNRGDGFAALASARMTNEEIYLLQKFTRAVMGSNNIDNSGRFCHDPSVSTLAGGQMAMPVYSISGLGNSACFLLIGSDISTSLPVLWQKLRKAVINGGSLLVIDPRETEAAKFANTWLQPRPGTDTALLMGIMNVIIEAEQADAAFIEERTAGYETLKSSLAGYSPDKVEGITGVPADRIEELAFTFAQTLPATILYSSGVSGQQKGAETIQALHNLLLLTGNIDKPGAGIFPLPGQNNVIGACEMGGLPNMLPGYKNIADPDNRKPFEQKWAVTLKEVPGLTFHECLEAAGRGDIKALYITGTNPAVSGTGSSRVIESLQKLDFLVVQDLFLTETASRAHVVLPAASSVEKGGTFTNVERRLQKFSPCIQPPGEARTDAWIISEIARRMGAVGFDYPGTGGIMEEISSLVDTEERTNAPSGNTGNLAIYNFVPTKFEPPQADGDSYPFVLITGRDIYRFNTDSMTGKVQGIDILSNNASLQISPMDAETLGIQGGEKVRIVSPSGEIIVHNSLITEKCLPGTVFISVNFPGIPVNNLSFFDNQQRIKNPVQKNIPVRIEKIS
ncbi:MAG: molybdopterin-dependent oxidoreductase, partial [Dehalococcoidia bacterium]|nr:molybdopterin-dependent oxidoreductase [Dehalococcoidia bacterium]